MSLIALATWTGFGLAAASAIAVSYALNRCPVVFADRRAVMRFAAIWLGALLFEFYALGPASYIAMNNDGNLGVTFYKFLVDRHPGGQFAHGFGGGFRRIDAGLEGAPDVRVRDDGLRHDKRGMNRIYNVL